MQKSLLANKRDPSSVSRSAHSLPSQILHSRKIVELEDVEAIAFPPRDHKVWPMFLPLPPSYQLPCKVFQLPQPSDYDKLQLSHLDKIGC